MDDIQGLRRLDTQPSEVHAAKKMEKATEVPKNDDQRRLQTRSSEKSLGQNEQMVVGQQARAAICNEPAVVSGEGLDLFARFYLVHPLSVSSVADRRAAYLAGTSRPVVRG